MDSLPEEHKYYTTLLLNCYVKQGGEKLVKLIESGTFDKEMLDLNTAIEVCIESKQLDCAKLLAEKAESLDQQLRILIEHTKEYALALKKIDEMENIDTKLSFLRRYGPQLIKGFPEATYKSIEQIAQYLLQKKNEDAKNAGKYMEQFKTLKEIFVDEIIFNKKFLVFQIDKDPNCEKEVYHSLIEWHLQDYYNAQKVMKEQRKEDASPRKQASALDIKRKELLELLTTYKEKIDKRHVLMLFEMYQVSEGVSLLCEMLELKNELMTYYMQKKDYASIVKLCDQFGKPEPNLWVQALTYFVGELAIEPELPGAEKYVKEVLTRLEEVPSISPLLVLEITSKNKKLKFSVLKEYLANRLQKLQGNIEKSKSSINKFSGEIDEAKQKVTTLRTTAQLFQLKDCSECGKKLELPIVHFMCGHSYHDYCNSASADKKECPKCSVQAQNILDKKAQLLGQMDNQEQFFKELKDIDKKFDVVAEYFGRGLFTGINKLPPKAPAEDNKDNAEP